MAISYKKLWKLLIDKDMKKKDLQAAAGISSASVTKLAKNENVNTEVFLLTNSGDEITSSTVSYSMKTMLQALCETSLTDSQLTALQTMCSPFKAIMENWNIEKLL